MRLITRPDAARYIADKGGKVWVWLDPRRGLVGSYVWLEAHTEPPGSSRQTRFTRSSRRPHRFKVMNAGDIELHYDWGRLDPPDELQFELRGWANKRLEAYWDGCIFVDDAQMRPPMHQPTERED